MEEEKIKNIAENSPDLFWFLCNHGEPSRIFERGRYALTIAAIMEYTASREDQQKFKEELQISKKNGKSLWLKDDFKPLKNKSVLEVGYSNFNNLQRLAEMGASTVVGIDPLGKGCSKENIKIIKRKLDFESYSEFGKNGIPEQFDLTYSQSIMDFVDVYGNYWGEMGNYFCSTPESIKKIQAICANLTKKGGYSIHAGNTPCGMNAFLNKLGMNLEAYIGIPNKITSLVGSLFVFKKVEDKKISNEEIIKLSKTWDNQNDK